jgi:hypothetical protein
VTTETFSNLKREAQTLRTDMLLSVSSEENTRYRLIRKKGSFVAPLIPNQRPDGRES